MRYVIAARYNDRGEQITEEERKQLVLDSEAAREIVAELNSRAATAYCNARKDEDKTGDAL